jgi:hypothetical protein
MANEGKMKQYFVRYSTGKYDGENNEQFLDLDQVTDLLSKHATNPDFTFDVIYGERIEFEPTEIVKAYKPKRS